MLGRNSEFPHHKETTFMHPSKNLYVGWLVVGFKADCITRDLGIWVECPPWGLSKES